jgi:putative copper resistance protein D
MLLTLAEFVDTVLHSAVVVGLAMALGGAVWERGVLSRPGPPVPPAARRRCLSLIAIGAGLLAGAQLAGLGIKAFVLRGSLDDVTLVDLVSATTFWVGALRAVLSLALVTAVVRAQRDAFHPLGAVALTLAALAVSGAWLTHAVGRLENRGALMMLTIVHQAAAAIWLGGLVQLAGLWRLTGRCPDVDALWPIAVRRFSRLAIVAVLLLIGAALPLGWSYTRTLDGLIGTGYGSLLLLKAFLLLVTLVLAALNLTTARGGSAGDSAALRHRLPTLVEGEVLLLLVLVFAATGLSALPPPADQPAHEQATAAEVAEVFRPKLPSLQTPSLEAMRQTDGTAPGSPRSREAYLWSNFSHNVAGLMLLAMALVSFVGPAFGATFSRHWPLGLFALAAFVYLRASANEGTWPFGATPIADVDAEGLQHRLAALLVLAMGVLEWKARRSRAGKLRYVFPLLCVLGAALLLMHSHRAFQVKDGYLVQITHSTMGALAGLVAVGRWLELRLPPGRGALAGMLASLGMLAIALILVFYREANVVIPP